jgi:hypothetical protein
MKKTILSTLLLFFTLILFAQETTTVTGQVQGALEKENLSNVVVSIIGTNVKVVTDANGNFELASVPVGNQILSIALNGYVPLNMPITAKAGETLRIGTVYMEDDFSDEEDDSIISLSEDSDSEDNGSSESVGGLLQSSKDVFSRAAAFNFPWFRVRGYDSNNAEVLMNGIKMNKIATGRPQWSDWGGLNDVLRNQVFANGLAPAESTFGGVLGSTSIDARATAQRAGTRLSSAFTNRNYAGRLMVTHNSGMNDKGWAYSVSASRRYAQEGYYEGSSYNAWSGFLSLEKKINDKHSFNLTALYTPNRRGKSSPNTQEVYDLKGLKYNSYWGKQAGDNRNSRMKEIKEPIFILSHYWDINDKTYVNTNIAYQTGSVGNSRLGYYRANNPDPTYYKKLPSYAMSHNEPANAYLLEQAFKNDGQLDWNAIYTSNSTGANADYYLYEDRNDDNTFSFNTNITTELNDNVTINGRINYSKLKSENFANMLDLLGAQYHLDIDGYGQANTPEEQYDLNNPNRKIYEGDKFNYNYNIESSLFEAFAQAQFTYNKVDFFVSANMANTSHQREGLYKNGVYANNSLGKGEKQSFNDLSFKGGLTYKITGRHSLTANVGMLSVAPTLRKTFGNSRVNNNIVPNITSQKITSFDASYIYKGTNIKARLTGYSTNFKDGVETAFYYAEGILGGLDANNQTISSDFVGEITTGVDKQSTGVEFGMEVQATPTIKITGVASVGSFKYTNNPNLYLTSETATAGYIDYGTTYLNNVNLGGTAQQAYSLGFEYRDPKYWWFGVNANYIDNNYINVSRITRTDNFYKDTDGTILVNPETGNMVTQEDVDGLLTQEKFDSAVLVNFIGGKSWKIGNKYIGVFANISNILGTEYKTGGFEQARKANFVELQEDRALDTPTFGSKYWYGNKTTYYLNIYLRF